MGKPTKSARDQIIIAPTVWVGLRKTMLGVGLECIKRKPQSSMELLPSRKGQQMQDLELQLKVLEYMQAGCVFLPKLLRCFSLSSGMMGGDVWIPDLYQSSSRILRIALTKSETHYTSALPKLQFCQSTGNSFHLSPGGISDTAESSMATAVTVSTALKGHNFRSLGRY